MLPNESPRNKEVWTYSDVADFLQVSEETVRKRVAARTIPFARIGRLVRFDPDDIRAWFNDKKAEEAA